MSVHWMSGILDKIGENECVEESSVENTIES